MNWTTTGWVKLYKSPDSDWVRLPLSTRGLGSESLKYARPEDGFLIDAEDEPPGVALAFFMGARPSEHERIIADVAKLLEHGFFELRSSRIYIRNFVIAQTRQTPDAIRKAKQRARAKAEEQAERDASRDTSRDTSRTTVTPCHDEKKRNDPTRSETTRSEQNEADDGQRSMVVIDDHETKPRFDFEAIFNEFPKKAGKKKGLEKLRKVVKTEADYRLVLAGAERYAFECRRDQRAMAYVQKFHNWVDAEAWNDEPTPSPLRQRNGAAPVSDFADVAEGRANV